MSTGHDRPSDAPRPSGGPLKRVSLRTLHRMARDGEPFACLACYDFTTARWLDRGGVHVLLAGDSAANVILGHETTHAMPLDLAIWMTAAVRRGAERAHVMADMPFMSYQASESEALVNAGRFLSEGRADSVKIEADASFAPLVEKMTRAGIPVCAHVGTKPQQWALSGGPKISGRSEGEAEQIVADALALERAGAVLLLIEAVPPGVAEEVVEKTSVPVIGIGAGLAPHGQILVVNDLVGLSDWTPRFVEPIADLGPRLESAGREWVERVRARRIGGDVYRPKGRAGHDPSQSGGGRSEESGDGESVRVVRTEP